MGVITTDLNQIAWARWRSTDYVETVEAPASPEMEFREDGTRIVRTFLTPWGQYIQAIPDFLGYPSVRVSGANKYISRQTPHYFPVLSTDNKKWLFCQALQRVEGVGTPAPNVTGGPVTMREDYNGGSVARYLLAKITLLYSSLTYEVLEDSEVMTAGVPDESTLKRYVTMDANPAADYLNIPFGAYKYVPGGDPVQLQPQVLVPNYDWQVTWHQIPQEAIGCRLINPLAATTPQDDALGKVNNEDFPTGAVNPIKPGQLLLTSITFRRKLSAVGPKFWDVMYRFKYFTAGGRTDSAGHPCGNNHLLRRDSTVSSLKWEEVTLTAVSAYPFIDNTTNPPLYHGYQFSKLFKPA